MAVEIPSTDDELLAECDVDVFRATGPGGQSVNTTDSAVRLTHRPTGLVVVCRRERSQLRNKRACLKTLRERLVAMNVVAPERVPTKVPRSVKARAAETKARRSRTKRLRKPPEPGE